ncbi:MAG: hypothetical protein WC607_01760 [Candidatus Micrarchaeia archaeon]
MRGQAAIEYLVIVALSLAVLLPLWFYVDTNRTQVEGQLRLGYAQQAVNRLRDAADLVYAQGPPAQIYVEVNVPPGIASASVSGRAISLFVNSQWGPNEVYAVTVANVTGSLESLPRFPGPRTILVKAERGFGSYYVNVTDGV